MMMKILGRVSPFAVFYAVAICLWTANAFLAGGGVVSSGRRPSGTRPGWPVGPAVTPPIVMGSRMEEGGMAESDRGRFDMHSNLFSVEPAASEHIFSGMNAMMDSTDRLEDGLGGMETDTAVEMETTKDAREKEKKQEEEEEKRKMNEEESEREKRENIKKWKQIMINTNRKTTDRGGLPPNGRAENDGLRPGSDAFSSTMDDVNITSDGFVPNTSNDSDTIVVVFLDSISLEEDGVSVVMAATKKKKAEDVEEVDMAEREMVMMAKESACGAVLKIGHNKERESSIKNFRTAAKGGAKESGDTSTSEASNKRTGQNRAGGGPLKWWGGVRGHRR